MFALIAHDCHFEKKYTGNTVTNELNKVVHFPKIKFLPNTVTVL